MFIRKSVLAVKTIFKQYPQDCTHGQLQEEYQKSSDYILIQRRWKTTVVNAKTLPGVDCESDHKRLCVKLKLRLKKPQKSPPIFRG